MIGWMNGSLLKVYHLTSYCMHCNPQNLSKTWFMWLPSNSFNICCYVTHCGRWWGCLLKWPTLKSQGATNFQNRLKH